MIEVSQAIKQLGESSTLQSLDCGSSDIAIHPSLPTYSAKNIKIDFPRFGGTDVLQWIFSSGAIF